MKLPSDITPEEIAILGAIASRLYLMLDDPTDKFIMMAHYEVGYSKTEIALALGISMPAVSARDKKIKKKLTEAAKLNSEGTI